MADGRNVTIRVDVVQGANGNKAVVSSVKNLEREVIASQKKVEASHKASARAISASVKAETDFEVRQARHKANEFIRELKRVERERTRLTSDTNRRAGGIGAGGIFAGSFAGSIAANAVSGLASQLQGAARSMFDFASSLQQSEVAFTSLMKNSTLAAAHIRDLRDLTTSFPLEFESIAKMSQRLQGAGIQVQKLIPLIKDIGNVAAATGDLSAARMEGIGTALSQIASKGRVSAEEMEQLAERGIPAWRILSEAIGKTAAETRKMAETGQISSDQLFAAFQKFSRLNYGDAMRRQARTVSGAWQQMINVIKDTSATAFDPLFREISKIASKASDQVKAQRGDFNRIGATIGQAIGETIGLVLITALKAAFTDIVAKPMGYWITGDPGFFWSAVFGLQRGAVTGMQGLPAQVTDTQQRVFDYTRPGSPGAKGMPTGIPSLGSDSSSLPSEKDLDNLRKEREQIAKAELGAQIRLYEDQLKQVEDHYEKAFARLFDAFKQNRDSALFQNQFGQLKQWYGSAINEIVPGWENLVKQKTQSELSGPLQRYEAYQGAQQRKTELTDRTLEKDDEAQKLLAENEKDQLDERLKKFDEDAQRRNAIQKASAEYEIKLREQSFQLTAISEQQYVTASNALKLESLEFEKTLLEQRLALVKGNLAEEIKTRYEVQQITKKIETQKLENWGAIFEVQTKQREKENDLDEKNLEDRRRLEKEAQEDQMRRFDETQDYFRNKLDTLIHGGPKELWKSLLEDFKRMFIDRAANLLAGLFSKGGQQQGGIFGGANQTGGGFGSIFGNIFGGGGGGTPPFNPNGGVFPNSLYGGGGGVALGGGLAGDGGQSGNRLNDHLQALGIGGQGGGIWKNLTGPGGMFGPRKNLLTGKMSKLGGAMGGIGDIAAMVGQFVPGRGGKVLSYAGMGASMGSMFGPWGAAIGAGVGTLVGLFGGKDDAIGKLKDAASSQFGISVKDKNTLKALKALGEGMFGKGRVGSNAVAVVRSEEGQNILRAYAESSGQSGLKIDRLNMGDVDWKGNQFKTQFGGYRASGGPVMARRSYVVGEHGKEVFTPGVSGMITPNGATPQMMGELMETLEGLRTEISRMRGISPDHVVAMGAKGASRQIAGAYHYELENDGRAHTRASRAEGVV